MGVGKGKPKLNKFIIQSDFPKAGKLFEQRATAMAEVHSIRGFVRQMREFGDLYTIDVLVVIAHGAPGALQFGKEHMYRQDLDAIQNVSRGFNAGAFVQFMGCNMAEGSEGELFLVELSRRLLGTNGGKVVGGTAKNIAFEGWLGFGEVLSPVWNDWIVADVQAGEVVNLKNPKCLNRTQIAADIKQYRPLIEARLKKQGRDALLPYQQATLKDALTTLDGAEQTLNSGKGYKVLFFAYNQFHHAASRYREIAFAMPLMP
jgi:hypothetical protein